jgi:hypothetical protein
MIHRRKVCLPNQIPEPGLHSSYWDLPGNWPGVWKTSTSNPSGMITPPPIRGLHPGWWLQGTESPPLLTDRLATLSILIPMIITKDVRSGR